MSSGPSEGGFWDTINKGKQSMPMQGGPAFRMPNNASVVQDPYASSYNPQQAPQSGASFGGGFGMPQGQGSAAPAIKPLVDVLRRSTQQGSGDK
jgi:hypothetical protein